MILAAGYGKRLRPLTDVLPKALMLVDEHTLIEKHLYKLRKVGVEKVVINTHWLGQEIIDFLQDGSRYDVQIVYSEEENLLDSGGGIKNALKHLGKEAFFVINADVFCEGGYEQLSKVVLHGDILGHVLLTPNPEHNKEGDFSMGDGLLCAGKSYTFSGISLLSPKLFELEARTIFGLGDVLRKACQNKLIASSLLEGLWFDVGTVERLKEVQNLLIR